MGAKDHGFTAFWAATNANDDYLRPLDSIYQVHWLINKCPRLQELLRILDQEGAFDSTTLSERPRFLVFSHWPIICWIIEMVLQRIGLKTVSITAAKSPEERALAAAEFNNPNSVCQVLNTTYNTGGTGLNLHSCCNVVILMEPAPNFNLETQAIGRVHRIGQTRPQRAYRLFQDHTINRYITGNNFRKMLPQLAAQFAEPFAQEVERRCGNGSGSENQLAEVGNKKASRVKVPNTLTEICEDYLRNLAGVCPDFPYHMNLLVKKKLGMATVQCLLDGRSRVKISNRKSQAERDMETVPPAKRKYVDDNRPTSRKRRRTREEDDTMDDDDDASDSDDLDSSDKAGSSDEDPSG